MLYFLADLAIFHFSGKLFALLQMFLYKKTTQTKEILERFQKNIYIG